MSEANVLVVCTYIHVHVFSTDVNVFHFVGTVIGLDVSSKDVLVRQLHYGAVSPASV